MLQSATLVLHHPNEGSDGILHIPCKNFPILPIGSAVDIFIPGLIEKDECHDFKIWSYAASSRDGSSVYLEWSLSDINPMVWGKLLQHAHEVEEDVWYLMRSLDFGLKPS